MDKEVSIQISDRFLEQIDSQKVRRAADQALTYATDSEQLSLTIVLEDNERIQLLNEQYMGIDAPTDVLSFPADYVDPDTGTRYLGDVIISVPQAHEQAASGGHSLDEELQLLVVHGVLHLLGYDHLDDGEREQMQMAQNAVLRELGSRLTVNLE